MAFFALNTDLQKLRKRINTLFSRVKNLEESSGGGVGGSFPTLTDDNGDTWEITGVTTDGALITTKTS